MSDTVVTLNNKSQPIPIQYTKSCHGFSDSNNDTNRYLFELVINGGKIGKKYFRNLEDDKYSHLIKLVHKIPLCNIESYKASLSIHPVTTDLIYDIEGTINQEESCSIQSNENLHIEFTKNDMGNTICSCFFIGLDYNKLFVSPPN